MITQKKISLYDIVESPFKPGSPDSSPGPNVQRMNMNDQQSIATPQAVALTDDWIEIGQGLEETEEEAKANYKALITNVPFTKGNRLDYRIFIPAPLSCLQILPTTSDSISHG